MVSPFLFNVIRRGVSPENRTISHDASGTSINLEGYFAIC